MLATYQPPDLAVHLSMILDGIRRTIAAALVGKRKAILPAPLLLLLWSRLGRMAAAFARLAAQAKAGALVPPRPAGPRAATSTHGPQWPRGIGWLIRLVQETAVYGSQLQAFLARTDMRALLDAAPRAARLLRPLCRMLSVPLSALPKPAPPRPRRSNPCNPPTEPDLSPDPAAKPG